MILEFFDTDNSNTKEDLEKIDALLLSDLFLQGLGRFCEKANKHVDFPIVTNLGIAFEMMTSQEIWDLLEPWPYQYFIGVIEDESGRLQFETGLENKERCLIDQQFGSQLDLFQDYLFSKIKKSYNFHEIDRQLQTVGSSENLNNNNLDWMISNGLLNEISGYIFYLIKASYFGGLNDSPIFKRMFEAFLTGGVPCGWVGALPEDGGDPNKCIQLFHLGHTPNS